MSSFFSDPKIIGALFIVLVALLNGAERLATAKGWAKAASVLHWINAMLPLAVQHGVLGAGDKPPPKGEEIIK